MRNISVYALASAGADSLQLSAMLGHLDSTTLKKYLSLQREDASKVVNDLSSRLLG
jgi:site-specific recombinase XerD